MTTDEIVLEIEKINSLTVFGYLLFGFERLERLQKEAEYENSDMGYLTILSETMLKELHIQIINRLQKVKCNES